MEINDEGGIHQETIQQKINGYTGNINDFIIGIGVLAYSQSHHYPHIINHATLYAITYTIAQTLDVYLFHYLRQRTQGRHLWLRNNLATSCSQLIDTLIFAILAWPIWARISLHEYLFKLIFALLDTPIVYLVLALSTKAKTPPEPTQANH